MGWSIAVGVIIFLALVMTALWGVYGDKLKLPLARKESSKKPLSSLADRKEPVFGGAGQSASQQSLALEDFTPPTLPELEEHWQADYCYVVRFFEEQVREVSRFAALRDQLHRRQIKIYRLLGFDENVQQWKIAEPSSSFRYWIMMAPLADRGGSLSVQKIKLLTEDCRRFAEKMEQRVLFSPLAGALERAKLLNDFCDEVDVVLNLRVVLGEALVHADVEELLQRSYMAAHGNCYVYRLDSEVMFSAAPVILPNNMVREIMFTLDAPKVSQPRRAFEDMVRRMEEIAELKQGKLFTHQDKEITETDLGLMRGGVDRVATQMTEKGVSPGSMLAHMLFG